MRTAQKRKSDNKQIVIKREALKLKGREFMILDIAVPARMTGRTAGRVMGGVAKEIGAVSLTRGRWGWEEITP
jgi:hypothetical protein